MGANLRSIQLGRLKSAVDMDDRGTPGDVMSIWGWSAITAVLGIVFVFGAIFYVWLYVQQVKGGYRLSKLYGELDQLLIVERKLRLEWARFEDPFLLEQWGRNQFKLEAPKQEQKVLMR
jgi:hypothetical protein